MFFLNQWIFWPTPYVAVKWSEFIMALRYPSWIVCWSGKFGVKKTRMVNIGWFGNFVLNYLSSWLTKYTLDKL
jgi:hypothetical protein